MKKMRKLNEEEQSQFLHGVRKMVYEKVDGKKTGTEIAEELGMKQQQVSRALVELYKKGYLKRMKDGKSVHYAKLNNLQQ